MQANAQMTQNRSLLTDKELGYLKDFLSWQLLAMKKCNDAATSCQDPSIRTQLQDAGRLHIQQYEALLSHVH